MENNWDLKLHVKSSMQKKEGQWHFFIGRWQPLHFGHKEMFNQILSRGENVCIGIRDGSLDDKNPFTSQEVLKNITTEYNHNINVLKNIQVIIIPDICSINFGRGVGYDIVEHIPPSEVAEISATKIREQMKSSL